MTALHLIGLVIVVYGVVATIQDIKRGKK